VTGEGEQRCGNRPTISYNHGIRPYMITSNKFIIYAFIIPTTTNGSQKRVGRV
jgi:hypothetical protein